MTTTTAPAAEQAVADARNTYRVAQEHLDHLKAQILTDGPEAVSAKELATAAGVVEHARLSVQHALAELDTARGDERMQQLAQLKATILEGAGSPDDALNAMQLIEQGVAYLIATCAGRQRNIAQWTAAMQQAGVPAAIGQQLEDGHAGLGWTAASMAGGDAVLVDDRRITGLNAGMLIGAAVARGCRTAGYSTGHLQPVLSVDGHSSVVDDPETWVRKRF